MAVLGSAEVELTLDASNAGRDAERVLTQQLGRAGDSAGKRLSVAVADASRAGGKKAGQSLTTALNEAARTGGQQAGKKIGDGLKASEGTAQSAGRRLGSRISDAVRSTTERIGPELKQALGVGLAVAGAAAAVAGKRAVDSFVDLAGEVRTFQRTVGTSAEESSRFVGALDDLQVSSTAAAAGMQRLARTDPKVLEEYGISAATAADGTLDLTGTLLNVADAYVATQSPAQRAQLLFAIFGRQGRELIPVLEQGRAGLEGFFEGVGDRQIFSQEDLQRAREYELAIDNLQDAATGFGRAAGSAIVPFLTRAANAGTEFLHTVQELPGPVKELGGAIGRPAAAVAGLAVAAALAGPRLRSVRDEISNMGRAGEATARVGTKIGKGLAIGTAVTGGILAAVGALRTLQNVGRPAAAGVEEVKRELLGVAGAAGAARLIRTAGDDYKYLGAQIQRLSDPSLGDKVGRVFDAFGVEPARLQDARESVSQIDSALSSLVSSGNAEAAARSFEQFVAAAERGGASREQLLSVLPGYRDALAGVSNASRTSAGAQGDLGETVSETTGEMEAQKTSAELLSDALDGLSGASSDNLRADVAARNAKDALSKALRDNGKSFDLNTPKGRSNADALVDARDAVARYAEAQEKLNPGVDAGRKAFERYTGQLVEVLRKAGVSEAKIKEFTRSVLAVPPKSATNVTVPGIDPAIRKASELRAKVHEIPKNASTSVSAPGADSAAGKMSAAARAANGIPRVRATSVSAPGAASAAAALSIVARNVRNVPTFKSVVVSVSSRGVGAVQREINSITGKAVSISVGIRGGAGFIEGKMAGGPVQAGEPYIVGEKRPEVFVPNVSGRIIPSVDQYSDTLNRRPVGLPGGTVELGPKSIAALAKAVSADLLFDRDKVGRSVSRTIGGNLHRAGV